MLRRCTAAGVEPRRGGTRRDPEKPNQIGGLRAKTATSFTFFATRRRFFEYLLGLLAKEYGIEVHAYVVMSNHYHLVITDTEGQLPNFQRELNSLLARSINALRNRKESFWERTSYNAVALLEDDDVVSKMAYTLANPVDARLVDRAQQWEGATSAGVAFGQSRTIARPRRFFSDKMPETVELELTRPDCHAALSDDRVQQLVEQEVRRREDKAMERGKALGMKRVLAQDWNSSPQTVERSGGLRPTVAGMNKWARIEALQRSKAWLREYREALAQFVKGDREVEFPFGTWWMGVGLGCNRAAA